MFGLVYAGILSAGSRSTTADLKNRLFVGLVLAVSLWFFAAGLVMPIWLQLVGIEASIPNLTAPSLIGHLVWGLTLGTLYHYGEAWLDESTLPGQLELDGLWKRAS